jgi:hypothetical protein
MWLVWMGVKVSHKVAMIIFHINMWRENNIKDDLCEQSPLTALSTTTSSEADLQNKQGSIFEQKMDQPQWTFYLHT